MNTDNRILVLFGLLIAVLILFLLNPRTPTQPFNITTNSPLPDAMVGLDYSTMLQATRGTRPYRWTWEGAPPAGLSLDTQSGTIDGRPEPSGVFQFRVKVTDNSRPQQSDNKLFHLTVKQESELTITTPSPLPVAVIGIPYRIVLQTEGANPPLKWSVHELPDEFTVNTSTGEISANPAEPGAFKFDVTVNDKSKQCDSKRFTLAVVEALVIVTNARLPNVIAGQASPSIQLTASGGLPPFTWSSDDLPEGVTLDPQTGELAFASPEAGQVDFGITVTDGSNQSTSKRFQLTVLGGLVISNEPNLPDARRNQPVEIALNAIGGRGTLTWSSNGLPDGLNLSVQTGLISGTPVAAGTFTFEVTVMDEAAIQQPATKQFTLNVQGSLIVINGRDDPLRWVVTVDDQLPIDPGADGIATVNVALGDTIEWHSEQGFHGVTFEAFPQAEMFLEFTSQRESFSPQQRFGDDAQGTDGQSGTAGNRILLARARVGQSTISELTFTCTIHGSLGTTTMDGRLNQ